MAVIAAGLGPTQIREVGVLRQETVTGMDGGGAGRLRGRQHRGGVAIGLRRIGRAEQHGLIGLQHEREAGIHLGVDGDGPQPHSLCGTDHPAGDLATVGHQQ